MLHAPTAPHALHHMQGNIFALTLRGVFSVMILFSVYMKLTQNDMMVMTFQHLGYPLFLLNILGIAYIIGVVAVWQQKYYLLYEWGHAGFAIAMLGAFFSHLFTGDGLMQAMPPLVLLGMLLYAYIMERDSI